MAKFWGILDGIQIAWSLRLKKVILETDSKEAIQAIQEVGKEQCDSFVTHSIIEILQCD